MTDSTRASFGRSVTFVVTNLALGLPLTFAASVTYAREVAEDESDASGMDGDAGLRCCMRYDGRGLMISLFHLQSCFGSNLGRRR